MNGRLLNIIYYSAIVILLVFTSYEAYKNNRKFISVLTALVAVITTWYAIHGIRKKYS